MEKKPISKEKQLASKIKVLEKRIAELEEENNSLDEIISVLPGHVYWKDKNGVLLGCNNEQAHAAGLKKREAIVGLTPLDLISKDQPKAEREKQARAIAKVDKDVIKSNQTLIVEEQAVLDDGNVGYFLSNKTPLHDKFGKIKGLVGVTLDITEQKSLQQRLNRANQSKSRFITNVATLMRDMLSASLLMTDVLFKTSLTRKQDRCVKVLNESLNSLLPCLDRLYNYVDLIDHNLPVSSTVFNLKGFLKDFVDEYKVLAQNKSIEIQFHYDNKLSNWVEGGRYYLSQVIQNLLHNAIKHTADGRIKVTAQKTSPISNGQFTATITIEDTGCGINTSSLNDLFNLFDGAHDQQELFVKTGLDLSISAKMLELINAKIEVRSKQGKGSSFVITVPLKKAQPQLLAQDNDNSYAIDSLQSMPYNREVDTPLSILVLDGDSLWQKGLQLALQEAYHCHIDQAFNLRDAKVMIKKRYDIIFMDVGSPDGDFLQCIAAHQKQSKNKMPPIIVVTACTSDDQREQINKILDVTDIVTKPVGYEDLISMIDYCVLKS
tara:strand:- start:69134 stop:70780 length:1647 start_codon:yes stop_codon:yes gene_type:complete